MVAFALAAEFAASGFQGLYNLTVEALTHLVRACSVQAELRLNADIDEIAGNVVAGGNPHSRLVVPSGHDDRLLHVLAP